MILSGSELALVESFNKHLFRPYTYLHKWWAREGGNYIRFTLKRLMPDIERRDYYQLAFC